MSSITFVSTQLAPSTFSQKSEMVESTLDEKIQKFSEKAIVFFNKDLLQAKDIKKKDETLNFAHEDEEVVQKEFLEYFYPLSKGEDAGNFFLIGQGYYSFVFSHKQYPQLVFKLKSNEEGEKEASLNKRGSEIIHSKNLFFFQIPSAKFIPLPNKKNKDDQACGLYIEKRLPLFSPKAQETIWDRILLHASSPILRANLQTLISQASMLIEEFGYWDVGPHNFPLFGDQEQDPLFCIDFQNIGENYYKHSKDYGLFRLASMLPVDFLVNIVSERILSSLQHECILDFMKGIPIQNKKMNSRQKALCGYDQKNIIKIDQKLSPLVIEGLLPDQKKFAAQIYLEIEKKLKQISKMPPKDQNKKTLIEERYVEIQPGQDEQSYPNYTQKIFCATLDILCNEKKFIVSWFDGADEISWREDPKEIERYCVYKIYF